MRLQAAWGPAGWAPGRRPAPWDSPARLPDAPTLPRPAARPMRQAAPPGRRLPARWADRGTPGPAPRAGRERQAQEQDRPGNGTLMDTARLNTTTDEAYGPKLD